MQTGIIEADVRHIVRNMRAAMQGNVIRALVELITNADDSYLRLEDSEVSDNHAKAIDIIYEKSGHNGIFFVRDYAEGMSIEQVKNGFTKYGAATSGLKKGQRVRGYFGQGAKDALTGMINGQICTFKNDKFVKCEIFIKDQAPQYRISDPVKPTKMVRDLHGIKVNGTVANFEADCKATTVPQFDTIHQELANNYLLRKIMVNPKRIVRLIDKSTGKERVLKYKFPTGKPLVNAEWTIPFDGFGNFPIICTLSRSEQSELKQTGDDRDGGLLIVDEQNAVLGISLFKYDTEPLAARFFGEVTIKNFRNLLEKEEAVLSDERQGLLPRHPFCKKLIAKIEELLAEKVNEEKIRKQNEFHAKIDEEEHVRYRKAFRFLNEIAENEAKDVINLGDEKTEDILPPPDGIGLYPKNAQVTVGKRYAFELRIDSSKIKYGERIAINTTSPKIRLITTEVVVEKDDGKGIIRKKVCIEGKEPNVEAVIVATVNKKVTQANVHVIPEKELILSEGMVFQPETVTLRPNQPRRVYLCVYVKMIEGGSVIRIKSDNDSVKVSQSEVRVRETDATRHIAKYEIDVWGEGTGETALVSAEYESYIALLEVKIKSKDEDENKDRKGMFNEPHFDFDPDPLQRSSYSQETGSVSIYVNFPSIKQYLGDKAQYKRLLTAQIVIADIVAQQCFLEIAKKKSQSIGLLSPEAVYYRIQRDTNDLAKKYAKKVHEALVDQDILRKSQSQIKSEETINK